MIFSTLPNIPHKECIPVGVVYSGTGSTDKELRKAFERMEQQANQMNADAVVDIRVTVGGESADAVIMGTAVQFT